MVTSCFLPGFRVEAAFKARSVTVCSSSKRHQDRFSNDARLGGLGIRV